MEFHLINAFYVSFLVECFVRLGEDKRSLFKFYDYDSFISIASRTKPILSSFHNKRLIYPSLLSFHSVPIPSPDENNRLII